MDKAIALVSGANEGLGRELIRRASRALDIDAALLRCTQGSIDVVYVAEVPAEPRWRILALPATRGDWPARAACLASHGAHRLDRRDPEPAGREEARAAAGRWLSR
jgi:hypothetical protein